MGNDAAKAHAAQIEKIKDWDHILQTLNHSLIDFLVAIAIIYSLSETYSILKTILLSIPEDKLSSDVIINHILVEEKSQQSQSTCHKLYSACISTTSGPIFTN